MSAENKNADKNLLQIHLEQWMKEQNFWSDEIGDRTLKGDGIPSEIFQKIQVANAEINHILLAWENAEPSTEDVETANPETKQPVKRLFWILALFSNLVPTTTRIIAFEPAYNDLKSDYLLARRGMSKGQQRSLKLLFFMKGLGIIVSSFGLVIRNKVWRVFVSLLPEPFRKFWRN